MKKYIEKLLNYGGLRGNKFTSKNLAFTLAEVLITLAIIGVVAAITIPTVITNYQTKQFEVARKKFESQMIQIGQRMNLAGELTSADNNHAFPQRFRKYATVRKVCTINNYTDCFPKTFRTEDKKTEYFINSLTLPQHIGINNNSPVGQSANVVYVFADGSSMLFSYERWCNISPFDNGALTVTSCFHGIVDTNGKKGPNIIGKDIFTYNAAIAGSDRQIWMSSLEKMRADGEEFFGEPGCRPVTENERCWDHFGDTRPDVSCSVIVKSADQNGPYCTGSTTLFTADGRRCGDGGSLGWFGNCEAVDGLIN